MSPSQQNTPAPRPVDPAVDAAAGALSGRVGYRAAKRALDVALSAAALVALSPLMLLTALAVRLDSPGPAIFAQERVGRGGRTFRFYKFRSMVDGAERMVDELEAMNEKDGPVFKIREDPRLTRVGRVIRKYSIDELPQFWNVLRGDMSVVGPRPPLAREVARYGPRERQRLLVRPGITCSWQVTHDRDSVPFDEWVDMDLSYIRSMSAATDLSLIARTVVVVVTGDGN